MFVLACVLLSAGHAGTQRAGILSKNLIEEEVEIQSNHAAYFNAGGSGWQWGTHSRQAGDECHVLSVRSVSRSVQLRLNTVKLSS